MSPWPALSAFLHEPNRSNAPTDGCGGWFRELLPVSLKRPVSDRHRISRIVEIPPGGYLRALPASATQPQGRAGGFACVTLPASRKKVRTSMPVMLRFHSTGRIRPLGLPCGDTQYRVPGPFPRRGARSCVRRCWTIARPMARQRSPALPAPPPRRRRPRSWPDASVRNRPPPGGRAPSKTPGHCRHSASRPSDDPCPF